MSNSSGDGLGAQRDSWSHTRSKARNIAYINVVAHHFILKKSAVFAFKSIHREFIPNILIMKFQINAITLMALISSWVVIAFPTEVSNEDIAIADAATPETTQEIPIEADNADEDEDEDEIAAVSSYKDYGKYANYGTYHYNKYGTYRTYRRDATPEPETTQENPVETDDADEAAIAADTSYDNYGKYGDYGAYHYNKYGTYHSYKRDEAPETTQEAPIETDDADEAAIAANTNYKNYGKYANYGKYPPPGYREYGTYSKYPSKRSSIRSTEYDSYNNYDPPNHGKYTDYHSYKRDTLPEQDNDDCKSNKYSSYNGYARPNYGKYTHYPNSRRDKVADATIDFATYTKYGKPPGGYDKYPGYVNYERYKESVADTAADTPPTRWNYRRDPAPHREGSADAAGTVVSGVLSYGQTFGSYDGVKRREMAPESGTEDRNYAKYGLSVPQMRWDNG
ncbi:hypothetical protein VF21_02737 [Pseudogymnoascus sp. 05NY08]|nr:hypothetical protein VF21_02737 [Pseudogymnoascus sp. 05NY08]